MDVMQVLIIVVMVLAAASLVMAVVFLVNLRTQQRTVQQAARRAVEEEHKRSLRMLTELRAGRAKEASEPQPEHLPKQRHPKKPRHPKPLAAGPPGGSETEAALQERSRELRERESEVAAQRAELIAARAELQRAQAAVEARANAVTSAEKEQQEELARLAGVTADEARSELLSRVELESRLRAAQLARDIEAEARQTGEARARQIIVGAIQRLAAEQTTESVVASVPLPSDEMKGRIIGREGRNIRAFEQTTGVNVLIDDTPESVLLSCFDPVRREVARLTLTELVADGRIHPARIEEAYERSQRSIEESCRRAAEGALIEMGIADLDPGLLPYLGALKYRTSYGQSVLAHMIECGHLAALIAAELGLSVELCRRAAFLHDIGKAVTHEVDGSHAAAGADLARRHGEHPEIVHAIAAHHNEVEPETVEAVLTQAADAISGGRPGARRESMEAYVRRLQRLEEIAKSHTGVDKVFAMQAGHEVRVMVAPDQVSDAESEAIAREIAREVQGELTYPGSIKVTVVRESRAVALAR